MGAGLLVGTALSVIIPEGMQTLNKAYNRLLDFILILFELFTVIS